MKTIIIAASILSLTVLSSCGSDGWSDEKRSLMINTCSENLLNGYEEGGLHFEREKATPRAIEACTCVQEKREKAFENASEYKHDIVVENEWMHDCIDIDVIMDGIMK